MLGSGRGILQPMLKKQHWRMLSQGRTKGLGIRNIQRSQAHHNWKWWSRCCVKPSLILEILRSLHFYCCSMNSKIFWKTVEIFRLLNLLGCSVYLMTSKVQSATKITEMSFLGGLIGWSFNIRGAAMLLYILPSTSPLLLLLLSLLSPYSHSVQKLDRVALELWICCYGNILVKHIVLHSQYSRWLFINGPCM